MNTKLALLGSLFLVACSGSTFSSIPDQGSGSGSGSDPTKPVTPALEAGAGSAMEASADAGSSVPMIAKHCVGPLVDPDLCIENVQGHAGETVHLDVYFLGTTAIDQAEEMGGHIFIDPSQVSVDNPADVMGCRTRRMSPAISNPSATVITWNAFGNNVVPGCASMLAAGKIDTIELHIVPGTPPGDYKLDWEDVGIVTTGNLFGKGMSGTLRVLP